MERVATLIHKLLEQYQQNADTGKLLLTTQMLLAELKQCHQNNAGNTGNVAVMIPSALPVHMTAQPEKQETQAPAASQTTITPVTAPAPAPEPLAQPVTHDIDVAVAAVLQTLPPVVNGAPVVTASQPANGAAPAQATQPVPETPIAPVMALAAEAGQAPAAKQEEAAQPVAREEAPAAKPQKANGNAWMFDPVHDVPTLTHQPKKGNEINQAIGSKSESLNERFRMDQVELVTVLQDSPIQDLKKAIGINDRYLFINELFRGDETMYERSIKTINSFSIYAEANYWIQRELTLKLSWNERSDIVKHFYQLVKRRFS